VSHFCTCQNCRPELAPATEQQGERHFATTFDRRVGRVYLDGVMVPAHEGMAGPDGWVKVFRGAERHVCRSCERPKWMPCAEIATGNVEFAPSDPPRYRP
jgi:hypothetical protein